MKHKDGYKQCVVLFDMDPLNNNDIILSAETVLCNSIGVGVDRNRIKEQLDSYRDKTRYNRKSLSVICDGGLGYTFTEVLDFIRCVESDMNKSIIDLWEKVGVEDVTASLQLASHIYRKRYIAGCFV